MRAFAHLFAASTISALVASCAPHVVSICGRSGGQCCGVTPTGSKVESYYACIRDNICPPKGISGTPEFPATHPPSGRCEVEYKDGWIWDSDSSATVTSIAVPQIERVTSVKAASGVTIARDDPNFCSAACTPDDSFGKCPRAVIPNDVSAGLLSLAVDFAETPNVPDQQISMPDLAKRFNASSAAIGCDRDPVVYSGGVLSNSGHQCVTLVSANKQALKAELTLADTIQGDVKTTPKIAAFQNKNMSLKLADQNWDKLFGGDILTASRVKATDIATKTSNTNSSGCFRLRPAVAEDKHLDDLAAALNADPSVIDKAVSDIRKVQSSISSPLPDADTTDSGYPQLMPLSEKLEHLVAAADTSSAQAFRSKTYEVSAGGRRVSIRPSDVVTALDMYVCSSNLGKIGVEDYDKFFPKLNARVDITDENMAKRDRLAGKLILCTYGAELFADTTKAALKDGLAHLNTQ
ncbi:hypothetical protein [Bradyrhizobium embrapense]